MSRKEKKRDPVVLLLDLLMAQSRIEEYDAELTKKIEESFADVQTIERKLFKEANFQMEKQVEDIILKDFPLPQKVDKKFYSYLRTIVRTKLTQEYHNYSDEAPAREFSLAFQQLFESLLIQHRAPNTTDPRKIWPCRQLLYHLPQVSACP